MSFAYPLRTLPRNAFFSDVTADFCLEERPRDAFINELASSAIRQHLPETTELTLNQAFELADNLNRAHHQSSCMDPQRRSSSI